MRGWRGAAESELPGGAGSVRPDARWRLLRLHAGTRTSRKRRSTSKTRSKPATGCSISAFEAIFTTDSRAPTQAEPRLGVAYNVKRTGTVLRASRMRARSRRRSTKTWCSQATDARTRCCHRCSTARLACQTRWLPDIATSSTRACSRRSAKTSVFSGEYIWKYTHNAFDFSVLGNTPITFPIDWHNSKIPGYALHVDVPNFHNISAYSVMSSVAARFFPPQVAGAGATVGQTATSLPH